MELEEGSTILDTGGHSYQVLEVLGEGGQGEVYKVEEGGERFALKIYKETMSPNFLYNLKNNIEKGAPTADFLWPKRLFQQEDGTSGYLMDLRGSEYVSFVSYLNGKTAFDSQNLLLKWCISLCSDFKALHERGFSYQDLNDGSFFLNPHTGKLLICDNDNVTADKKSLGVLGKMKYMAPEIVTGNGCPDTHSDRFSLAIILFMALCLGNPFEGERLKNYDFIDEKAEYEMYGSHPVFIYHQLDASNRPIRGYHGSVLKRWPRLPRYIQEAFHHSFVDGIVDRENGRTTELEWLRLLTQYRDELVTCPCCGYSFAYGLEEKNLNSSCPNCHQTIGDRCILKIGRYQIVLEEGKEIYTCHLDKYSSDYQSVLGRVIRNKKNPSILGIRLFLEGDVIILDRKGNQKVIEEGGVIPLVHHLKVKFPHGVEGEII